MKYNMSTSHRTGLTPEQAWVHPMALAVAIAACALSGCTSNNTSTASQDDLSFELFVTPVSMRDGVELYTEVLLPAVVPTAGVPTLLLRTPYDLPTMPIGGLAPDNAGEPENSGDDQDADTDNDEEEGDNPELTRAAWQPVLDRGYAVVFQNLRGTQTSGGRNDLFAAERADGVDTLEWIQEQSWSNGRVGAMGDSAAGFSVHLLAAENPPGLDATFSQLSCGDIWSSAILPDHGGVKLEAFLPFMLGQSLELGEEHLALLGIGDEAIDEAQEEVNMTLGALLGDDLEKQFSVLTEQPFIDYPGVSTLLPRWRYVLDENSRGDLSNYFDTRGESNVPGMHVGMWQDIFVECTLGDFNALNGLSAEQRLLMLDGSHYEIDDADSWPEKPMLDWFDQHLKDIEFKSVPAVQYALQSADSVEERSLDLKSATAWPPLNVVEHRYYLGPTGGLSLDVNRASFSAPIVSDPTSPQSGTGGRHLVIESGIADQGELVDDDSNQVFTTIVNNSSMTIAGEITLDTTMVTDLLDADIHARLVEVTADGRRVLIVEGMQRARYSGGALNPMDITPGLAVPVSVALGNVAHKLSAGSQLQLELVASNFPAWNLNPQIGSSSFVANGYQAGTIKIQSTPENPSVLIIPTLPE